MLHLKETLTFTFDMNTVVVCYSVLILSAAYASSIPAINTRKKNNNIWKRPTTSITEHTYSSYKRRLRIYERHFARNEIYSFSVIIFIEHTLFDDVCKFSQIT